MVGCSHILIAQEKHAHALSKLRSERIGMALCTNINCYVMADCVFAASSVIQHEAKRAISNTASWMETVYAPVTEHLLMCMMMVCTVCVCSRYRKMSFHSCSALQPWRTEVWRVSWRYRVSSSLAAPWLTFLPHDIKGGELCSARQPGCV